jgi:1-deoxyxylulose-5-phosphate synthase
LDYVRLGNTGLQVSRVCLGCMSYGQATTGMHHWPWTLSEEDGRTFIRRALDLGVNFFDTANNYSDGESEAVLGWALRDFVPPDEVVLATKVCAPVRPGPNGRGLSRKAILSEIGKRLQRLCPHSSISTKSISLITRRRLKRRSAHSTMSFDPARFAISERRIFMPGS